MFMIQFHEKSFLLQPVKSRHSVYGIRGKKFSDTQF